MRCAGIWLVGLALWASAHCAANAQAVSPAPAASAASAASAPVIVAQIDGAIGPATADHLHRALGLAVRQQAQLVVLQIDTPGGLDASMRSIIKDILASPVP